MYNSKYYFKIEPPSPLAGEHIMHTYGNMSSATYCDDNVMIARLGDNNFNFRLQIYCALSPVEHNVMWHFCRRLLFFEWNYVL